RFVFNKALPIDLGPADGATDNTSRSATSGPNLMQDFPYIGPLQPDRSVSVYLNGLKDESFTITLYAVRSTADSWSARYLQHFEVRTDGDGTYSGKVVVNAALADGEFLAATATSRDNNTSEMGRPREPTLFVPGIGGVAPRIDMWKSWYRNRGFDP